MKVSRASETSGPIGVVIDVDRWRSAEGTVTIVLAGEVDVSSVPRLRAALVEYLGRIDIVLDLSGVAFCDSSALRVLVDAQRASSAAGHHLEICDPSPAVQHLFEVSGVRGVLHVS